VRTSVALDVAGLVLSMLFVSAMVLADMLYGRAKQDVTLRRLIAATRVSRVGVGVAVLSLAVHLAGIPHDGVLWSLFWVVALVASTKVVRSIRQRRDSKGHQVVAAAEQVLRSRSAHCPALYAEVERGAERHLQEAERRNASAEPPVLDAEPGPLHAHEITAGDAALIRMMAGAHFADNATVILPSGKTISGAEMRRWVRNQEAED
jgi:hypothetical protein